MTSTLEMILGQADLLAERVAQSKGENDTTMRETTP